MQIAATLVHGRHSLTETAQQAPDCCLQRGSDVGCGTQFWVVVVEVVVGIVLVVVVVVAVVVEVVAEAVVVVVLVRAVELVGEGLRDKVVNGAIVDVLAGMDFAVGFAVVDMGVPCMVLALHTEAYMLLTYLNT